jgi:FKBP-type peptidyl-prolyl cis-trans isomerase SlyD
MKIDENSMVSMEYKLFDKKNNDLLDSNIGREPLTFIVGQGQVIKGLEEALLNKEVGFEGDISISVEDAYGEYDENAVESLPKENFAGIELKEGMPLYGQGENGETVQVAVKKFDDSSVTVDYNHHLAGKELLFSVSVLNVKAMTPEEIASINQTGGCGTEQQTGGGCGSGCGCN